MIHKIGNVKDVDKICNVDEMTRNTLLKYARILTEEYGSERNVDNDYGGYVLYVPLGTPYQELKAMFDYTDYSPEYVEYIEHSEPTMCVAVYITSSDYGVVIVMSLNDMPDEIRKHLDESFEEVCPHCDYVNTFKVSETTNKSGQSTIVCKGCGKVMLACSLCGHCGIDCGRCSIEQEV